MKRLSFLLPFILTLTSCAWVTKTSLPSTLLIDCAVPEVAKITADLVPVVVTILEGHSPDWSKMLTALESIGKEALACAVKDAEGQFIMDVRGTETASPAQKASDFINQNGWKFKGVTK